MHRQAADVRQRQAVACQQLQQLGCCSALLGTSWSSLLVQTCSSASPKTHQTSSLHPGPQPCLPAQHQRTAAFVTPALCQGYHPSLQDNKREIKKQFCLQKSAVAVSSIPAPVRNAWMSSILAAFVVEQRRQPTESTGFQHNSVCLGHW